ncbi:MAG TPA: hypothetical protein VFH54_12705 [Mycobacteriales bacterium]|nr:hypothetical protein [Mycobacteriales bacterium]
MTSSRPYVPDETPATESDRPSWFPVAPEMCGQCGSGDHLLSGSHYGGPQGGPWSVLAEFTCRGCGCVTAKFASEEDAHA